MSRDSWKTPKEVLGGGRAEPGSIKAGAMARAQEMAALRAEGKPWLPKQLQEDFARIDAERVIARAELDGNHVDVNQRLRRAGCNEQHLQRVLEAKVPGSKRPLEKKPTYRTAMAWDAAQGAGKPFLLMLGQSGTGKTFAATCAMGRWAQRYPWNAQPGGGVQVEPMLLVRASTLHHLGSYDEECRRRESELCRCPFLILDDLGADNFSGTAAAALHTVIDSRWGANRLTIITSNLRLKGLSQRLDGETPGRFSRRLTENAVILEEESVLSPDDVRALLSRQGTLQ